MYKSQTKGMSSHKLKIQNNVNLIKFLLINFQISKPKSKRKPHMIKPKFRNMALEFLQYLYNIFLLTQRKLNKSEFKRIKKDKFYYI